MQSIVSVTVLCLINANHILVDKIKQYFVLRLRNLVTYSLISLFYYTATEATTIPTTPATTATTAKATTSKTTAPTFVTNSTTSRTFASINREPNRGVTTGDIILYVLASLFFIVTLILLICACKARRRRSRVYYVPNTSAFELTKQKTETTIRKKVAPGDKNNTVKRGITLLLLIL